MFYSKYLIEIENKEKFLSISILTSKTHSDDFVSNTEEGGQRETSRIENPVKILYRMAYDYHKTNEKKQIILT